MGARVFAGEMGADAAPTPGADDPGTASLGCTNHLSGVVPVAFRGARGDTNHWNIA